MFSHYKKWYLSFVFCLVGCYSSPTAQESCGFILNGWGERISFKNKPIKIYINHNVPSIYHDAIFDSIDYWNLSVGKNLFSIVGIDEGPILPRLDGKNVIYFINNWEGNPGENGRMNGFYKGNKLNDADVLVNIHHNNFFTGSYGHPPNISLESLLVHELGHVLGLAHNNEYSSIMYPYLNGGEYKVNPTVTDIKNVRCEY